MFSLGKPYCQVLIVTAKLKGRSRGRLRKSCMGSEMGEMGRVRQVNFEWHWKGEASEL